MDTETNTKKILYIILSILFLIILSLTILYFFFYKKDIDKKEKNTNIIIKEEKIKTVQDKQKEILKPLKTLDNEDIKKQEDILKSLKI